mmetsp:Transcript_35498/g.92223  ORF Transcript_35498/g.92223 Transcript_35498/m.92223 type:complete len:346 (-) Transcript_35498:199-1236(-)
MSALAARRAELGLVAGSPVSGAARYGARSAGQIGVRERLARVTCPGRNRGLHVVSRSHRAGAGRGPPSREPKWPPETPRDLEALCEAAAQPSPSGLPRAARPALCSRDHTFLQRQQALMLPGVDWGRYQLKVLFVDRSGTVRSRVAAGLMELIVGWNQFGASISAAHAGTHAETDAYLEPSTTVALLGRACPLGVSHEHFPRRSRQFTREDFYRYDLIVALDSDVHLTLLDDALREAQNDCTSDYYDYLRSKVGLLSDFFGWCSDDTIVAQGAASLLPLGLVEQLGPKVEDARGALDVMRPDLQSPEGMDEWQDMNSSLVLGCASLTQFLIDALPEEAQWWEDLP